MKFTRYLTLSVLLSVSFTSCVNPYDRYPEGTVADSAPVGYDTMVYGGITYWYSSGHYYRRWPGYGWVVVRPPHNRPPHTKPPKPEHPIEKPKPKPKPEQPIHRPDRPSTQPVQRPAQRPVQRPSTQPVQRPVTRPVQRPAARPAPRLAR
ncbi:MAG: hypothetical protein ACPG4K_09130 [Haloferula sp.]